MIIRLSNEELTKAITEYLSERYSRYKESLAINYVCITDQGADEQHIEVEAFFETDED